MRTNSFGMWFEKNFQIYVTDVNEAPTIAVAAGGTCSTYGGTMKLTIAEPETPAGNLTLRAQSWNTTVVPTANILFGGSGDDRSVSITSSTSGSATINIIVSDGMGMKASRQIQFIKGTTGSQPLTGSTGSNLIVGMGGLDTINGGASNDLLCGGSSADTINGGADTITGRSGNDRLSGGDGNDTLTGSLGADFFSGGAGTDRATDFSLTEGDTRDSTLE